MWATASSLTKVAILAIVTCLFAAVWSNDQRLQAEFAIARREAWSGGHATSLVNTSTKQGRSRSPRPSTLQHVDVDMELPVGIAPGRYHVIEPGRDSLTIQIKGASATLAEKPRTYRYRIANGRIRTLHRIDEQSPPARPVHEAAGTAASERR